MASAPWWSPPWTYLELEGAIAGTGPFDEEHRFQPHRPSADILTGCDEDRRRFLKQWLPRAVRGRTGFTLDLQAAVRSLGESREQCIAASNYLEEGGDLMLKVAGGRRAHRLVTRPAQS